MTDYSHGHGPSSGIPLSTNSYTAQSYTIANSTLSYTYPESSVSPAINNNTHGFAYPSYTNFNRVDDESGDNSEDDSSLLTL